jgi:phage baseplate assembly protein W
MTDSPLLGTDLRIVLGPPGMAAYDAAALDLRSRPTPVQRTTPRAGSGRPFAQRDASSASPQGWQPEPADAAELSDLDTISGRENVAQALMVRLLTPKGSLTALGHANYGSRLGELIGQNKTEELRGLCRAYILEAVREEPRIENKPLAILFDPAREQPWDFVVEITVQPVSGGDPVTLGVEVGL